MGDRLPNELLSIILSRLPSKSLLRCRSVCKSWLSLISSSEFQCFHLQNFNQLNPRNLMHRFDLMHNREMFSVHLDDVCKIVDTDTLIEFPFGCNPCTHYYLRIIGCLNGVVCLSHKKCAFREEKIILWNPSIRKKLTVFPPKIRLSHLVKYKLAFGFGYDKMTNDYKIVRFLYNYHYFPRRQVAVYSVKTAIWRKITFPLNFPSMYLNESPVFLHGCVHWIAYRWRTTKGPNCAIIKFDVSRELFAEIPLPKPLGNEPPTSLELALIKEHLVVIQTKRFHIESRGESKYVMWVMKGYENPASWMLIYDEYFERDWGRILGFRDNRTLIMVSTYGTLTTRNYKMGYYDGQCGGFIMEDSIYIDKYQESLALLDVGYDVLSEDRRGEQGLNE